MKNRTWKRLLCGLMMAVLVLSLALPAWATGETEYVVVLDPGHGGSNGGASATHDGVLVIEDDLCWKIANYCKEYLEANYDNIKVILSRGEDEDPELKARVQVAIDNGADYFLSMHLNAVEEGEARGALAIIPKGTYREGQGRKSKALATAILNNLEALGLKNQGYMTSSAESTRYEDGSLADGFYVIRYCVQANIPGIIMEHAFIDSYNDYIQFLSTDEKLRNLGIADAKGLAEVLGLESGSGGSEETGDYTISHTDVTLQVGETFTLKLRNAEGEVVDVTWKSDDRSIAFAEGNVITGAKAGTTSIRTTVDDVEYRCVVRVKGEGSITPPEETEPTEPTEPEETEPTEPEETEPTAPSEPENDGHTYTISHTDVTLQVGETFTLRLKNEEGETASVKWTSNNRNIAFAEGNVITGAKAGTTTVWTEKNGEVFECIVRVKGEGSITPPEETEPTEPTEPEETEPEETQPTEPEETEPEETQPTEPEETEPTEPEESGPKSSAENGDTPFTDVYDNKWYYDDVTYVYQNGLMNGVSDTTFEPATVASRAMAVTLLYRLDGENGSASGQTFTDVKAGSWYYEAVEWAYANGITKGVTDTEFAPKQSVTREQFVTFMYRYAKLLGLDVTAEEDLSEFADADAVSKFARDAVCWAVDAGLVKGSTNGKLNPKGELNRAELAALMRRFDEYLEANAQDTWTISHTDVTIAVGESFNLRLRNQNDEVADVTWTASKDGYVTIDGNKITGKAKGTVTVSCEMDGQVYECIVRVKES